MLITHERSPAAGTWNEDNITFLTVESVLFDRLMEVRLLLAHDNGRLVAKRLVAVLHDFLSLTAANRPTANQLLWADCLDSLATIDYGTEVQPGETELAANQRKLDRYRSARPIYALAESRQCLVSRCQRELKSRAVATGRRWQPYSRRPQVRHWR